MAKILHLIRRSRVLETWLTRSGHRTYDELRGFEETILALEWDLCYGSPLEMIVYTTLQEFATGLNYRNLPSSPRRRAMRRWIERSFYFRKTRPFHFHFYKDGVRVFMDHDRDCVFAAVVHVLKTFRMPAQHLIPNWPERDATIRARQVFNARIFTREVLPPVLKSLDLSLRDLRAVRKAIGFPESDSHEPS